MAGNLLLPFGGVKHQNGLEIDNFDLKKGILSEIIVQDPVRTYF
jgi:hypothetical protein